MPAPVSDGTRLNLSSSLAETAANLQKTVSTRKGAATDPVLVAALGHVQTAVRALCAAVVLLADEVAAAVAEEGGGDAP